VVNAESSLFVCPFEEGAGVEFRKVDRPTDFDGLHIQHADAASIRKLVPFAVSSKRGRDVNTLCEIDVFSWKPEVLNQSSGIVLSQAEANLAVSEMFDDAVAQFDDLFTVFDIKILFCGFRGMAISVPN
jgi:hypothetical protein